MQSRYAKYKCIIEKIQAEEKSDVVNKKEDFAGMDMGCERIRTTV